MQNRSEDSYWRRQRLMKIEAPPDTTTGKKLVSTLEAMNGVYSAELQDNSLTLEYDLRKIDLNEICAVLLERNIPLRDNVVEQIKRWLVGYKEAVRQAEQFVDYGWDAWVQDAYVSRYRLRRHGQRDDRLTNWRQYEIGENAKTTERG